MTCRDICRTVLGLAHANFKNDIYLNKLIHKIESDDAMMNNFNLQELSNLIWSCGKLQHASSSIINNLISKFIKNYKEQEEVMPCALVEVILGLFYSGKWKDNKCITIYLCDQMTQSHVFSQLSQKEQNIIISVLNTMHYKFKY